MSALPRPRPHHLALPLSGLLAAIAANPAAGEDVERPDLPGRTGLSGAMSAGATVGKTVDDVLRSLRFGAYGELHYQNFQTDADNLKDRAEVHRLVLLAEAKVSKSVDFVLEIEFEHGGAEVEVEQAFLDWHYHADHRVQAGVLLVPISIGNLYHEPTLFHGVERPEFDRVIIPTTWFEAGIGASGKVLPNLDYTVAIQAGLDASNADGQSFSAANGIRGGRQKGIESDAEDLLYTGRLDYRPIPGLWLAAGATWGSVDQGEGFNAELFLYTLEARWNHGPWDVGVSWAQGFIDGADDLPNFDPVAQPIAEEFQGVNAYVAYDILPLFTTTAQRLYVFTRYEIYDTQAQVPDGATADESFIRDAIQVGITWKPTPHIAVKADYRNEESDADDATDVWALGVGFAF